MGCPRFRFRLEQINIHDGYTIDPICTPNDAPQCLGHAEHEILIFLYFKAVPTSFQIEQKRPFLPSPHPVSLFQIAKKHSARGGPPCLTSFTN